MNIQCMRIIVIVCCILYNTSVLAITLVPPVLPPDEGYCFIQNYVDVSPMYGGQDFHTRCRSYNKHKGTDFRVSYDAMLAGVDVVAAADGRVLRTRDKMKDVYYSSGESNIGGRECGNGVVIDHGDGWQTLYCHLKKDSVLVRAGDVVEAGTVIGQVGLSGKTEFAHVHFQVSRNGEIVCPFSGICMGGLTTGRCKFFVRHPSQESLWEDDSEKVLQYVPSQVLRTAYLNNRPHSAQEILQRSTLVDVLKSGHMPLVFSAVTAMLQEGDTLILELKTVEGVLLAEKTVHITHYTAQRYDYIGKKDSSQYADTTLEGYVVLRRNGAQVFEHRSRIVVE